MPTPLAPTVSTPESRPLSAFADDGTALLHGSSLLVTGGTGSFGQAFVRAVLSRCRPRRLVVFSRDEQKQYDMARELSPEKYPCLRYFIGDVRDRRRLQLAMAGIDYVVHAAAMKHVPIAEYNPFECIRTNISGAENVVYSAMETDVKRVIALSTDKAANPINLYGATKLAADKCFIAANHLSGSGGPRFAVVRYGNVIGSRGSVVEHFRRLVASGATELPVTDMRMTRFWITLEQGVDFVLRRLSSMSGGEVFVPKIPSTRLVDLAAVIGAQCDLREVGIRPGEKLHEVLIPKDEARNTLEFSTHYTIEPAFHWWKRAEHLVENGEVGRPVPAEFEYSSHTNEHRIGREALLRLLDE